MKRVFLGLALATALLGGSQANACPSCERAMQGRFNVGVLKSRYSEDFYLPPAPELPPEKAPAKEPSPPANKSVTDKSKPETTAKSSPSRTAKKPIKEP